MPLTYDYGALIRGGPQGEVGLDPAWLEQAAAAHAGHLGGLTAKRAAGTHGFFDVPDDLRTLELCTEYAAQVVGRVSTVVIMGIGGSALGTRALHAALSPALHDLDPGNGSPRLLVIDNVDPALVADVLRVVDLDTTLFNVISKSGSTAETMSQFLLFFSALKAQLGDGWTERVVVTTDAEQGFLRPFAEEHGLASFVVPANVGGRFSVLTPVGLLPACLMGWDAAALLAGAARGRDACLRDDFASNPGALMAASGHLMDTRLDHGIQVLFPYSHRLRLLGDWNVQLVAESLGKRTADGTRVGPLPHSAVGATDQHSQVQLFVDGPQDKVFTFVRVEEHADDVQIPGPPAGLEGLSYLGGKSFGQLLDAECVATRQALTDAGRPNATINFPRVDAAHVGEFLMWNMCATAYGGELYGVDAFDQPGVEAGKVVTYGLMGRPGFEEHGERVRAAQSLDAARRVTG
ncbi:MAG: glucose-6-phosphate isomerase [Planctomycetota bacterium]|nr:MAG: glucose-6-phosphate isomerase [Planctomycetota bacterium]